MNSPKCIIPYDTSFKLSALSSGKINVIELPEDKRKELVKKIANEVEKHLGFCFSMAINTIQNDR